VAKYYIQSGKVSYVVAAHDVEGAALWAMHRTIDKMVAAYESEFDDLQSSKRAFGFETDELIDVEPLIDPADKFLETMLEGLAQFDENIYCSQIGFGRDDQGVLETDEVFRHWRQLMQAADYLFDRLN
jgi:hypothetical protein